MQLEFDESKNKFDKYGRVLAYVFVDGLNVNLEMIKKGFAYEYTYHGEKYKYQKEFKNAEQFAKENGLGL